MSCIHTGIDKSSCVDCMFYNYIGAPQIYNSTPLVQEVRYNKEHEAGVSWTKCTCDECKNTRRIWWYETTSVFHIPEPKCNSVIAKADEVEAELDEQLDMEASIIISLNEKKKQEEEKLRKQMEDKVASQVIQQPVGKLEFSTRTAMLAYNFMFVGSGISIKYAFELAKEFEQYEKEHAIKQLKD